MSRAFVNEDANHEASPRYDLPKPGSPDYEEAVAWVLIQGADAGDSRGAEIATGYVWGDPALAPHVRKILTQAAERGDARVEKLATRFLRAAGEN
ncbi:MAG: hypothetical protein ACREMQ_13525 [Longimicrobiales bacterium]